MGSVPFVPVSVERLSLSLESMLLSNVTGPCSSAWSTGGRDGSQVGSVADVGIEKSWCLVICCVSAFRDARESQ